ncbi:MAG TPA: prolipoprotein diacylglyceryl transferase [Firmicutes bacterium]|nr:prolipoprotein diacylglyceryl transferase [Bacillota bacterium]
MGKAIAFQIGPLTFYWYGIIIATGIFAGFLAAAWQAKRRGENAEHILDILFYALPLSILGARIYYVLFTWEQYKNDPWEALAIWHGGLAIHGAVIAAVLVVIVYTRIHKLSFWHWADICAPSLILGQAIGRWGNFVNQEAFGAPTDLPWAIYIDYAHRPVGYEQYDYFHPTFLYESLWNFAVFFILQVLSAYQVKHRRIVQGGIVLSYFGFYSLGRFFVEGLRLDSLMFGPVRVAQLVSIMLVVISFAYFYYRQKRAA